MGSYPFFCDRNRLGCLVWGRFLGYLVLKFKLLLSLFNRMKQFYETYYKNEKLSLLVREIGWTNNMLIVSQTKTEEKKEFYINITAREKYSKNELLL